MTLRERIAGGGLVLVVDAANVGTRALFELVVDARGRGAGLRVVIPMTSHVEKLLDLRQDRHRRGKAFDPEVVSKSLVDKGVELLPLDAEAADGVASRLFGWFPTDEAWQEAKRTRLGTSGRAPATIDWLTAAMCEEGAVVVTDDAGAEFRGCERVGSGELSALLRDVGAETGG